jgi:ribosomal protein L40E
METESTWQYWRGAYYLQILITLFIFAFLLFPWHQEHGTGLQLMNKALTTMLAIGHPFDPSYVPVSVWWIVWAIPGISLLLAIRAYLGLMMHGLAEQRQLALLAALGLGLGTAWYIVNFYEHLLIGFWLEVANLAIMILAILFESSLPEDKPQPRYHLGPTLSEYEAALARQTFSPICPQCGALNHLAAEICQACGGSLYV